MGLRLQTHGTGVSTGGAAGKGRAAHRGLALDIPRRDAFHGGVKVEDESGPLPAPTQLGDVDYESEPLKRSEYIAAIVHLYRGELYRATSWRIRLDNTTNWAVLTTAGLMSVSFGSSEPDAHFVLLFGTALITIFWLFEARRYRFCDIWYSRVRKIEENFYGPILRRSLSSPERAWGSLVAEDLFHPAFKITRLEALRARFLRNYWAIYGVMLVAWCLRLAIGTHSFGEMRDRLRLGPLKAWVPLSLLLAFLCLVLVLLMATRKSHVEDESDHWNAEP